MSLGQDKTCTYKDENKDPQMSLTESDGDNLISQVLDKHRGDVK